MFERFNSAAIKTIMLAQEETRKLGHNYVGTEQILLGLLSTPEEKSCQAMNNLGITLETARREVQLIIGHSFEPVKVEIPFTPNAKALLENSWTAARDLGSCEVKSEHLLFGLLKVPKGVAHKVLNKLNVTAVQLEAELHNILQTGSIDKKVVLKANIRYWHEQAERARKMMEKYLKEKWQCELQLAELEKSSDETKTKK